ncbi:TatD family hydrolase [Mesobacillus zeae]|uniref:TatD family deoxyribonuclease n=1 Tax=Mesobacillus zeae TaxID=1917180 RepID=A0A398B5F5_9BACI|nr:TatD family hydrolase [Mesobacillus zeae]RID85057.1 TatD family deoxyribonuclease [Mesobacillus zeae]
MPLIDTHVHIDFYPEPEKVALQYEMLQIYALFVTNLPEIFNKHFSAFQKLKYVRLCLGYHPQISSEYELDVELFKRLVEKTRYIGEVGLDFHNEHENIKNRQINAFEFVTSPCFNKGRVYSIHSKQSEDLILDILIKNNVKHAIFHWYSGKISTLEKIIEQGYYFSLNPKMLTTKNGNKIIDRIPHNKILFETDGPFARYNKKIIYPTELSKIYSDFGNLIPSFNDLVFNNFRRLLIEKDLYK